VAQPFQPPEREEHRLLELKTLGGIDLRDASGRPLDSLVRQPKRVALLLYLALAEPRGFHRRDTLLALFWPDLDAKRARAALRKTLYVVRGAVGADVIVTRGDDEIGVVPEQIDCDVFAFQAALSGGQVRQALELYRGDLLAGFFVSDVSPEWEQWLDARRTALKARAAEAAWTHAAAQVDAGEVADGIKWARWANARAPGNERSVRRLMELLDGEGDRAGAMEVYQIFRSRLAEEYGVEPDPETQALLAAIGARTQSPTPHEATSHEQVAAVSAPPASAETPAVVEREPRRRPLRKWALVTLPLLAVGAIGLGLVLRSPSPPLEPNLVAVAPFTILSPGLEVWREGLVDLLARNLDGAGPLRTVAPTRAIQLWHNRRAGVEASAGLGRQTGAGLVVFGSMLGVGADSARLSASVLELATGRSLGDIEIRGATDHMDVVVDSLTRALLRTISTVRQIGSARRTGIGSSSVPALKAFLKGEQFRRKLSWDSAQIFYEEATTLDSTFALAWLRLGEAHVVSQFPVPLVSGPGPDHPWRLLYRAGTLNRGLGRHDSLVVEVAAGIAGFVLRQIPPGEAKARATQVYQTALEAARLYPEDVEAWFGVGAVQDFLGGLINTTTAQTYASYSTAIALDSGFAPAYRAVLRISGDAGDVDGTRRLAERFLILNPSPASRAIPALIAGLLDPATDTVEAERLVDSADAVVLWPVLTAIWLLPDSAEAAVRVAREMAGREPDPRYWFTSDWITRRNLAAVLAYRGHLEESLALATAEQSTWFSNLFPELVVWGVGAVPAALADSAFDAWRAFPGDTLGLSFARWWWAARGNTEFLRTLPRHTPPRSFSDEAFLALARRDAASALGLFTAWHQAGGSDYFGLLAMVRLMVAEGEVTGALAILNGREPNDWPIPSHVVWTLERARLSELTDDPEAAARDYQFVADVWRHADPGLQRFVTEAREATRRLAGGGTREDGPIRARIGQPGATTSTGIPIAPG